jgi:predicted nucleic acid-binding protein
MTLDRTTGLFFDASCLIAAAGSPSGGSGFLLSLCARGFLRGVVSQYVLLEAERNIQARLSLTALNTYHNFVATIPLLVASIPAPLPVYSTINAKDAHVVAASVSASVSYLLTLDKRLMVEISAGQFPFQALAPGDFIKFVLPSHVDFPRI